jgi:hypothetical protein
MMGRFPALFVTAALLLPAANKKISGTALGENQDLILHVTLYLDAESVNQAAGADLGGHFFVAEVKVDPKYGKEITIDRDDFVLRTDKDGEKATPFAPSQIAGSGALVVKSQRIGGNEGSILYGGVAPNVNGPVVYKEGGKTPAAAAEEKTLTDKVLPEKKTDQPVSGLLYFSMEKQKLKDLELTYGPPGENRITLRFKAQ